MKAAVFHGARNIHVEEVQEPEIADDEVLLQVEWCGLCGTDLHEYLMGPFVVPSKAPHPLTNQTMPVILGHEFAGRVIQASPISGLKVGDAVVADPRLYCRNCTDCSSLNTNGCTRGGFLGLSGCGGGFASKVAVHQELCYPLPNDIDIGLAALIEPLAVAWRAMKVSGIKDWSKEYVLILGAGPIGQALLRVLRANGASLMFVSELASARQTQAKTIASEVFDPRTTKVAEKCREVSKGAGFGIVFDCAGVGPAMLDGFSALKFQGVYVNVAGWETPFTVPLGHFMMKEVTIKASVAYNDQDFKETVEAFCSGKFENIEGMVTGRIKLGDIVKDGFEELVKNKDRHIKILVNPKESI